MVDAGHFERHADLYSEVRPPYPAALWDRLTELGMLRAGTRALDIGAGTGLATGPLQAAGLRVTAVEPGESLAARLRASLPAAEVLVDAAETVPLDPGGYSLAVVATAVHWLDLAVVLPRLHAALEPGGRLAVWWTVFGDPSMPTPFRERMAAIVARRNTPPRGGIDALDRDAWQRALTADGHFVAEHAETYPWSIDLDTRALTGLFTTFSNWTAAEAAEAGEIVTDLGGMVTEHYLTSLILLRRVDRPAKVSG